MSAEHRDHPESEGRDAARRRARLDRVFGDVLPGSTRDDRDDERGGSGGPDGAAGSEAWLRAQVPPHHG